MEETAKKPNKVLDFFIKTLNGTAYGLFATLIVGTIFGAISTFFSYGEYDNGFCWFMTRLFSSSVRVIYSYETLDGVKTISSGGLGYVLQMLTGAGIGVGVGLSLKFDPLKTIVLAAVGEIAAFFSLSTGFVTDPTNLKYLFGSFQAGDPLTIYFVCILTALAMKYLFCKKTPVDVVLIPLAGAAIGLVTALGVRYPSICVTYAIRWLVANGTQAEPFSMGIIVAVLMGMALTAPISSAAIAAVIFVKDGADSTGLMIASGAAIVGCSTQMIGFAVQSRKDNPIGTVISVAIGTSMFQFKNILKKPVIWLPTIITSAILGPISTCWIKLQCEGANAGMGTAGLVGQIGTVVSTGVDKWQTWVGIFGLQIVAPAILVFLFDLLFRKLGWIKEGDLKI